MPLRRRHGIAFAPCLIVMALLAATSPGAAADATPYAAAGGAQLPVGEADGVRIVRVRGAIVVVFTPRAARLYRRVAGKRVSVLCEEFGATDDDGFRSVDGGGTTLRAPKRGRRIRTGDLTRGMDYCRVWLEPRTERRQGGRVRYGRELIVSIPLTQAGAVRLDEQSKTSVLVRVFVLASAIADSRDSKTFPTAAEVVQSSGRQRRLVRIPVVALPTAADTPAAGSVGYYSDGQEHAAAVIVSAAGRRLFLEYEADGVIRTNVVEYLYGPFF